MILQLNHSFVSLNDYINKERANKFMASKIKQEETDYVYWACKEQKLSRVKTPVLIVFTWYCKDKRKDPDNIAYAKKYILDGMVKAGVLEGDGWKYITAFKDDFYLSDKDYCEVELIEGI